MKKKKEKKEKDEMMLYAQESFLCQTPRCYLTKPPDDICASIDFKIERTLSDGSRQMLSTRTRIPEEYQRMGMAHVERGELVLETMAMEQGFKSPLIKFKSWEELGKRMGYKDRVTAREKAKEFVDYDRHAEMDTNFHHIYGNEKKGVKSSYTLLNRLDEASYIRRDKSGKEVEVITAKGVWMDNITYRQLQKKGTRRLMPIKNLSDFTDRELVLYKFIFNEMLTNTKWHFKVKELKQILSIFTDDKYKIRQEIGRVMRGLKKKDLGITKFDLDDELLVVYGRLITSMPKKERKALQKPSQADEPSEQVVDIHGIEIDEKEKLMKRMEKINYTSSDIDKHVNKYPRRIKALLSFMEENPNLKAKWLRWALGEGKKKEIQVGEWDIYDIEEMKEVLDGDPVEMVVRNEDKREIVEYLLGTDFLGDEVEERHQQKLEPIKERYEKEIEEGIEKKAEIEKEIKEKKSRGERTRRPEGRLEEVEKVIKDSKERLKDIAEGRMRIN